MTPERGFAARWLRLFPFPLKIHFKGRQLPAGQEFSQIFFRFCNAGNEILATGGAENFSFHSLHHRVLKFAKQNGNFFPTPYYGQKSKMPNAGAEKFLPHLLLQSEQGKMAGNGAGQQKKQQIFFRLTAFAGRRWRLVFSFENSFHIGMINGELLRYVFKRKRLLLEYIPQNMQSLYLSQYSIYIVFQQ